MSRAKSPAHKWRTAPQPCCAGAPGQRRSEPRGGRRGVRWRSRAGWFASPISDFSALFACLRGCLVAIVFILWIRIALRDACTTTSPALGARRVATQEGAVDMDSNACRAREVEPKVWRDNDPLLRG